MISSSLNSFLKTGLKASLRLISHQTKTIPHFSIARCSYPQLQLKKSLYSNPAFLFSTSSQQTSIPQLQQQLQQALTEKGDNSMQYLQKLHELSFANAKTNNISKAIELYEIVAKKFQQNIQDKMSPAMGDTLKNLQILYKRGGKIVEFIPLTLRLIEIRIKELGQQNQQVANEYNELGVAYYHIQNIEQALSNYHKALKIRQELFGKQSLEVIQIQNNIATAYYSQGQFPQAKKIFEQNINKLRKLPGFNEKMIITPMTNLGAILQQEGKHQQALEKYHEVLNLLKKVETKDTYFLANIYHSMGVLCLKMNDIEKAYEYHSTSLKINLELYKDNHPSVAENYHNLGVCEEAMGQFEKSIQAYNKSIQIKKNTLGPKHPSLAQTYNNLGIVYKLIGNISEARKQYEQALQVLKTENPDENSTPIFGDMYMNIGTTYLDQQNAIKASDNFIKAQKILKLFFDQSHPKFADLYFNKAKIEFIFTRDFVKAREYLDHSIENYEKFSPSNPNLYIKYSMKGSCFFEERKFTEAIKWYTKSYECLTKTAKGTPEQLKANTALLNYQLGASYYELKEYTKAQENLQKAIAMFQQTFAQAHETLIELYFLQGNIEKALNNFSKAQESYKKADASMTKLLEHAPGHPALVKKQMQIRNMIDEK